MSGLQIQVSYIQPLLYIDLVFEYSIKTWLIYHTYGHTFMYLKSNVAYALFLP